MLTPQRAKAVAIELVVVFAGVLIALAMDSWWAWRGDQARLRSNLEALTRDMEQAAAELDEAIVADSATVHLLADIHGGLISGDSVRFNGFADLPSTLIRIAPLPLGTLRFLIDGGDVRMIENGNVRSTLIEGLAAIEFYQGVMRDNATDGRRAYEAVIRAENASFG